MSAHVQVCSGARILAIGHGTWLCVEPGAVGRGAAGHCSGKVVDYRGILSRPVIAAGCSSGGTASTDGGDEAGHIYWRGRHSGAGVGMPLTVPDAWLTCSQRMCVRGRTAIADGSVSEIIIGDTNCYYI